MTSSNQAAGEEHQEESDYTISPLPIPADRCFSPEEVLNLFGALNPYLLFTWVANSLVWALIGVVVMSSSFTMGTICPGGGGGGSSNCTDDNNGTLADEFHLSGEATGWALLSSYLLGTAAGGLVFPALSDRHGRRPVLCASIMCLGLMGCWSAFATNIFAFVALRSIQGFFSMVSSFGIMYLYPPIFYGCGSTSWVLAYESVPARLRAYTALLFGMAWVGGYCLVAPLAICFHNWRQLTLVISAAVVVYALFTFATCAESLPFLVNKGDRRGVEKWLSLAKRGASLVPTRRIQSRGERTLLPHVGTVSACSLAPATSSARTRESYFRELINNPLLLIYSLVMVQLFSNSFTYYGLSVFTHQLQFDRYWKHVLTGLAEVPAYLLSPYLMNQLGRRPFLCSCHLLIPLSLCSINFINDRTLGLAAWLVGKFAAACSFISLYVYASEIFPTGVRNASLGLFIISARLSAALIPITPTLAALFALLPILTFSAISLLSAFLIWILPETKNEPLPEHIGEMRATWATRWALPSECSSQNQRLVSAESASLDAEVDNMPGMAAAAESAVANEAPNLLPL